MAFDLRRVLALFCLLPILSVLSMVQANTDQQTEKNIYWEYPWFKQSFLDLSEDLADAADQNKGIILYFHQAGCPYCKKLLNDNFKHPQIVAKLRKQFDFIAINIWGDRQVVDFSGNESTEKKLAEAEKVMFTPTLLFYNAQGKRVFRLNGYYPPQKFDRLLDYLAPGMDQKKNYASFLQYYRHFSKASDHSVDVTDQRPPLDYQKRLRKSNKPVMLLFTSADHCSECREFDAISKRSLLQQSLAKFERITIDINSPRAIITPQGKKTTMRQWAMQMGVQSIPAQVFLVRENQQWREVFRNESYLRGFHFQTVLQYVADQQYRQYPQFQRYVRERIAEAQQQQQPVDLWK